MRQIVLDTETTGLNPAEGHRLVEIGCVEILNLIPTGEVFHTYLDPERDMPPEAEAVHGLSREFLKGKPLFKDIADSFLAFLSDSQLVIHNAEFDLRFLNAELKLHNFSLIQKERVLDTLLLARRKHPGGPNTLDGLCARYKIDNSRRTKHGALLDSEILAEVYAELCGGRQAAFALGVGRDVKSRLLKEKEKKRAARLASLLTEEERAAHRVFVEEMGADALWFKYGL